MAVRGVTEKIGATFVTSIKKTDIDIDKDEGLILSVKEHMSEYRRPWKLVTLAIGIGLLIIGAGEYCKAAADATLLSGEWLLIPLSMDVGLCYAKPLAGLWCRI